MKITNIEKLLSDAKNAGERSYSPYSHFRVGAALLTSSGNIYTGCNVENRSYPAGVCAEIVAVSKAVSFGECEFESIAIVGLDSDDFLPPCGVCRQFITEFSCDITVIIANKNLDYKVFPIADLLPLDSLHSLQGKNNNE